MCSGRKGDEGVLFTGGKFLTRTNFTLWLLAFGTICLIIGLVFLYLIFKPPNLGYFLFNYFLEWLQNRNMYLYLSVVFLLLSAASFVLVIVYEKRFKAKLISKGRVAKET